jgi:hypothetical protein
VLHLSYTADDMGAFARDQGYDRPPFRWDEEDRLRRRARLDALFFHLYGLDREAADYVLGTFPIVSREEDRALGPLPLARWPHSPPAPLTPKSQADRDRTKVQD